MTMGHEKVYSSSQISNTTNSVPLQSLPHTLSNPRGLLLAQKTGIRCGVDTGNWNLFRHTLLPNSTSSKVSLL